MLSDDGVGLLAPMHVICLKLRHAKWGLQEPSLRTATGEQKLYCLDLHPQRLRDTTGRTRFKKALHRWGTPSCFVVPDLYTMRLGAWETTEIEERFFGRVDREGKKAIEFFDDFDHCTIDHDAFHHLLDYMSVHL